MQFQIPVAQSAGDPEGLGNLVNCEIPFVAPREDESQIFHQLCAVDGEKILLHRDCQNDLLGDLSIPPFLQRTE